MGALGGLGRLLIGMGLVLLVLGGLFLLAARFGWTKLPGDIVVKKENFTFYAPVGLMILVSLVLTLLLNLFARR
jgi:hypothetical protein